MKEYKGGYDSDYDPFIPQNRSIYKKKKKRIFIAKSIRRRVYKKSNYKCIVCEATDSITIDHIIPLSKGGKNKEENMQTLCKYCNLKKANN